MKSFFCLLLLQCLASVVSARLHRFRGMEIGHIDPETEHLSRRSKPFNGWGTFDQLLNHSDPHLGTFKQRYWYGTEFWKGPGSPIIVVSPGEQSAEGFNQSFFSTKRLSGVFAEKLGGAVILLEHRYWGESSPFDTLTVKNLQHLTLENSIHDLSYFAKNFVLPFDPSGRSSPANAPWVFSGGSYSGALAAWLATLDPGTYWAYHGSSAVVQALEDFWTYFAPIMEATPQNCSADLQAVIAHVDDILGSGTPQEKIELKAKFKLNGLTDADFASALEWGPWTWQENQFSSVNTRGFSPYHRFCDYIENAYLPSNGTIAKTLPGPKGVGLDKALDGYARWMINSMLPGFCEFYSPDAFSGKLNTDCLQLQNASNPIYTDLTVGSSGNRQWNWMLCNEPFEWWQAASPSDVVPTLTSRLVTPSYWRAQCALWFPPENDDDGGVNTTTYTYSISQGKRAADVNAYTGGWFTTNTTRVMHTNGELDPWREATLSARGRPGGPVTGSSEEGVSVRLVKGGMHCSDMYAQNWEANEEVKRLMEEEVEEMKRWVGEFYQD
ncbi:serine carboxypeptidase S28-domain-containing protein [Immersiella caudata]|uniref:Serine carboxypeptidase S28-domain-containing protein n=1 Tax=Immersiella caudata TaxID=314043 RepID=A0AA39WLB0_9PEZI|nr:serine carboxypeptidase S28-domain-containing protein [Immersiella caudata]